MSQRREEKRLDWIPQFLTQIDLSDVQIFEVPEMRMLKLFLNSQKDISKNSNKKSEIDSKELTFISGPNGVRPKAPDEMEKSKKV